MQLLVADLVVDDQGTGDAVETARAGTGSIWSPYDAYEAAETLLRVLNDDKAVS